MCWLLTLQAEVTKLGENWKMAIDVNSKWNRLRLRSCSVFWDSALKSCSGIEAHRRKDKNYNKNKQSVHTFWERSFGSLVKAYKDTLCVCYKKSGSFSTLWLSSLAHHLYKGLLTEIVFALNVTNFHMK